MTEFPTFRDKPIPGQAAALVYRRRTCLARFPYEAAGGREQAHAYASQWRDKNAPDAVVRGFTGRIRHIWEAAR